MATRLYLPSTTGGNTFNPTPDAAWETVDGLVRAVASTVKVSSVFNSVGYTVAVSGDADNIIRQFHYGPIAAQTLSAQTIKYQIRAFENNANGEFVTSIGIRVISPAGTVRGTVLAVSRDATEVVVSPTTPTNRSFSATSSSVTAQDGDYVIIELGISGAPGHSGRSGSLNFGDASGSDLAEDDSTTTANNPWVEFANTISLGSASTVAAIMHRSSIVKAVNRS